VGLDSSYNEMFWFGRFVGTSNLGDGGGIVRCNTFSSVFKIVNELHMFGGAMLIGPVYVQINDNGTWKRVMYVQGGCTDDSLAPRTAMYTIPNGQTGELRRFSSTHTASSYTVNPSAWRRFGHGNGTFGHAYTSLLQVSNTGYSTTSLEGKPKLCSGDTYFVQCDWRAGGTVYISSDLVIG
jgi:hypothetical protein